MSQAERKTKSKKPNLVLAIMQDWWQHKLVLLLVVVVIVSAYAVIYLAWKNRDLNHQMQSLKNEQDSLDVEWRHMLLELNALSEHSRIEKEAGDKLGMKRPSADEELIIKAK